MSLLPRPQSFAPLIPQELAKIVKDNYVYARVAKYIGSRATFNESKLEVGVARPRFACRPPRHLPVWLRRA